MVIGIGGTGPYSRLKDLRTLVRNYKYELRLIAEGEKRQYVANTYQKMLAQAQAEIQKINTEIKLAKGTGNA